MAGGVAMTRAAALPLNLDEALDQPWSHQASLQLDRWLARLEGPRLDFIGRPKLRLVAGGKS